ncbi:MAG: DEAD/DEAH box helicase family protein [Opitutae bacterium]|nr:DEAD/DEAH box helicase family protein [Opitutae bacterium]
MEIDPNQRIASLNVRELSEFRNHLPRRPNFGGPSRWRATLGQKWHETLRKKAESEPGNATFEKTLKSTWIENGWQINLTGKIDQLIANDGSTTICEIKTIAQLVPMDEDELLYQYPAYFAQLQTYLAMALHNGLANNLDLQGELIFINITEGLSQTVKLTSTNLGIYETQREKLKKYLSQRSIDHNRVRSFSFTPPFPSWRSGQEDALEKLRYQHEQIRHEQPLYFEAPTGFGKTGVALQFALEKLQAGAYDKIFCLTGKSTGQNQILLQLAAMQKHESPRFYQLRSREEHAINSNAHSCNGRDCTRDLEHKWTQSGLNPGLLFGQGTPSLEQVRKLGAETGICPYEISRSLISYADIIIGDFNYVFSERHKTLLLNQEGLPLKRILLLIDEAHNLPSRVQESLSASTNMQSANSLLAGLETTRAPAKVRILAHRWTEFLQALEPTPSLQLSRLYEAEDLLSDLLDEIINNPINWDSLPENSYEVLRELLHLRNLLGNCQVPLLAWVRYPGEVQISCLDPSQAIAESLSIFGGKLLMSATLSPIENFIRSCGQNPTEACLITADADWRDDAYRFAIDLRVDTRLKNRVKHGKTTAETIIQFANSGKGPVVAYFPSYEYAEAIQQIILKQSIELPVALQRRGIPLAQQNTFLKESLKTAKVLLLMMGGSFAESIDLMGGQVSRAIIVGPSLPVADNVQHARMARLEELDTETAYHRICREPALMRIQQAIGRMVRAPGQSATILFHCCRFSENNYKTLFDKNSPTRINNNQEFKDWLAV